MKAPSAPPGKARLRRAMRSTEFFTLAFGSIVGVGWMVVLEGWFRRGGPLGAMLGFLIAGIAIVPVVVVYGRLAERIPEAGSEVAFTQRVFPRWISFATGWSLTLTYIMIGPWETVAMTKIAAYTFPGFNTIELYELGQYKVYLPGLLAGLVTAIAITVMNYRGIVQSSAFQNVTTFGLLAIFCVFAPLGLARGNPANLPPLFAHQHEKWGIFLSIILVLQIAPYYLLGFETIPKCAEEAAEDFATRRFLPVMLVALASATLFYVSIPGIVALLQPWQSLLKVEFATAEAFRNAFGSEWLVRFIMFGVVLSLLKVFNGNFLAATRLLYAMGSKDMLGGPLGRIHPRFQTPTPAILLVGMITVLTAMLGQTILEPISEVGSFTCVLGWLATCLSYCWGAAGPLKWFERTVGFVGASVAATFAVISAWGFGKWEWTASAGWAVLGAILWLARREDAPEATL